MELFRRLFTTLAVLGSFVVTSSAYADGKLAVVDVQRAVMQTEDGLRAQAQIKKLFEAKQNQLDGKQKELQKQHDEIEKQAKVLSREAMQKRQEDWQRQMMELQSTFMEMNKELEKKQKEITDPIVQKLMGIVDRVAKADGIDVVIDKATTHFVRADLDITDRCIQMYNGKK